MLLGPIGSSVFTGQGITLFKLNRMGEAALHALSEVNANDGARFSPFG